ncbi:hypothetical protein ACIRPN_26695 [Streptomyces sp. NPDC101230]|uniref:hypothetical protein n=1 Tax=unclassified Streptomyces TaxID=2593676 RepID=UPI00380CFD58
MIEEVLDAEQLLLILVGHTDVEFLLGGRQSAGREIQAGDAASGHLNQVAGRWPHRLTCRPLAMAELLFPEDRLTLSVKDAPVLTQNFLEQQASHEGMALARVEGERARVGGDFSFDCQSAADLRAGDLRGVVVGTGYLRVDGNTGECRLLGAVESAELDLF